MRPHSTCEGDTKVTRMSGKDETRTAGDTCNGTKGEKKGAVNELTSL